MFPMFPLEVVRTFLVFFFFFNDTATTEIYTLSLPTLFRSDADDSIVNLRGRFQLLRHDPVGGSSGRSVVHTPRHWETGRREPPSSRRGRCIYRAEVRRGAEGRSAGW